MLRSMTGFARGSFESGGNTYFIEIQSINRKSLDIHFHMPREFAFAEFELRKCIGARISRGNIQLRVVKGDDEGSTGALFPDKALLKKMKAYLDEVDCALGTQHSYKSAELVQLALQLGCPELVEDEPAFLMRFVEGVEHALEKLCAMRANEGKLLEQDLHAHVAEIEARLMDIKAQSGNVVERYRQRLSDRIKELGSEVIDDERVAKETVLLADRVDITEELTRLRSHCAQFYECMAAENERKGRTLDFLIQEMHREINTIGAKSQELTIAQNVVSIKAALDKLREQVQNIE